MKSDLWVRTTRVLALLMALALVASACAKPSQPTLRWNGSAVEGVRFFERRMESVSVHYLLPTSPEQVETVARAVASRVEFHRKLGRADFDTRVDIWMIPDGLNWPVGAPAPVQGRQARAVAPNTVLMRGSETEGSGGLYRALPVALTQGAESPAFQVDWLHEGMGSIMAYGWDLFPGWGAAASASQLLDRLRHPDASSDLPYNWAAHGLAALVTDRWGVNWPVAYPRTAGEMTPDAALRWATGLDEEQAAAALWEERLEYMTSRAAKKFDARDFTWVISAADMSPVRVQPQLGALPKGPGPNDNYSPHAYEIDVRYEPRQRTVSGTLLLRWQNGEGIPVDTLYFHLWPNAEQLAMWGAGITIGEVQVEGKPVPYTARGLDLTVPLGRQVEHGGKTEVFIRFTTRLPGIISQRDFGQEGLERFNLTHWYPTLAVLDDRGWVMASLRIPNAEPYAENTRFKVRLDVPAGFVVGATGRQVARHEESDRWIYEYDAPNYKDWVATGGLGLKEHVRVVDGINVRLIEKDEAWIKTVGDEIERGLRFYNRKFGQYPYPDLVVSCCVGMEWPGLMFTIGLPVDASRKQTFLYVTHHELGHQWFYGLVGNDQYHEAWLDEGFTTYADRTLFRSLGWEPYGGNLATRPFALLNVSSSHDKWAVLGNYGNAYYKGARVLEELEEKLGPDVMDRLMKEWVRTFQFKTATTPDFIRHAEQMSGQDLGEFFRARGVDPTERGPYRPSLPLGQAVPR